jgi:NifU-like protein
VRENRLSSVEEVTNYTKAGGSCGACHEGIEDILTRVMAERGEAFVPAGKAAAKPAKPAGMTNLERMRLIEKTIEELRPQLQADHGDIELVDIDGKTIYVRMTGACNGCQLAGATLGGVQQRLVEVLGEFVRVVPATPAQAYATGS